MSTKMSTKTKKRSASFVDDSDDSSTNKQSALKKTKNAVTTATAGASGKDDDGNPFWEVRRKLLRKCMKLKLKLRDYSFLRRGA